ncbi:argininosuccinate lyase [Brucella sp. IR073]|uniref:argininosuccinate lyase n=1 Tax=unclassified Brucella TaxID=2632610 RepID=UPI003B97E995
MHPIHEIGEQRPEARLDARPAKELLDFYEEPHLEREKRQFPFYIKVDLAHTVMLAEQAIISASEAQAILNCLREVEALGPDRVPMDASHGSLLFQIERYLFSRIGERIGGRMHTGRSRLDQGPTARRLYKRAATFEVLKGIVRLRSDLLTLASRHHGTIMPGYTCLQHAHPSVLGQYLLSFCNKLADDFQRLVGSYRRLNMNPLGGAGLSGTSWPINRARTTELLGFDGLVKNSRLVREAYYAADLAGNLSLLMATLNDLATDLHIWSSYEFGFAETADELCGTSSIFPQKKNPAALEAVKFAAGDAVTWLSTALATFRAEGTGDVVMREVPLLDRAFAAASGSLSVMSAVIKTVKFDENRMRELAGANWSTATELADEIVRKRGTSFREAHNIVGRLVRIATLRHIAVSDLNGALLDEAARELCIEEPNLDDVSVRNAFDVEEFRRTRTSTGSINPVEIAELQAEENDSLTMDLGWIAATQQKQADADQKLETALKRYL